MSDNPLNLFTEDLPFTLEDLLDAEEGFSNSPIEGIAHSLPPEVQLISETKQGLASLRLRLKGDSLSTQVGNLSKGLFSQLQTDYISSLDSILKKAQSKKGKLDDLLKEVQGVVFSNYYSAYTLGKLSVPEKGREDTFLKSASREEANYAKNFVRQTWESGKFSESRKQMYAKSLEGAMTKGWITTLNPNALVFWILHAKESCLDCLALAKGSPYSLNGKTGGRPKLPTVPRLGSTRCKVNCKCSLRIEHSSNLKESLVDMKAVRGIREETYHEAFDTLNSLHERLNHVKHELLLEDIGLTHKKFLLQRKKFLISEIEETRKVKNFPPSFSTRDVLAAVDQVKGMKRLEKGNLKEGMSVVWLKNAFAFPALVEKEKPLTLFTTYGRVLLKSGDNSFVFLLEDKL